VNAGSKPDATTPVALPDNLVSVHPNEAGVVPILVYHRFGRVRVNDYGMDPYPADMFRDDLDWLYHHNYYPIALGDFARGKIDCPAGKSPVIITFDDSWYSQFWIDDDGSTNPDCAVAILEAFHKEHSDWPLRATFFVIAGSTDVSCPFYQPEYVERKLQYLVKDGFEIGNHTRLHLHMNTLDDDQVQAEIASCTAALHKSLPNYPVTTFALPYGDYPKNVALVASGQSDGQKYHHVCAVAFHVYKPALSPIDSNFDPYHIDRIAAGTDPHQLQWWLDYLEKHPSEKYVSDGDPSTFTIPSTELSNIDPARVAAFGRHLRLYNPTANRKTK